MNTPVRAARFRHSFRQHSLEIFKLQTTPTTPWSWSLITGICTFTPLAIGYAKHEAALSIFGGLTGYLIGLCDHPGTLGHRLLTAFLAAMSAACAFYSGIFLQGALLPFLALTVFVVYGLGIAGGRGAEFERLIIFSTIDLLVARYTRGISIASVSAFAFYFAVACLTALLAIFISSFTVQKKIGDFLHIRLAVRQFFSRDRARHVYAFVYALTVAGSVLVVDAFQIERGYWTVVTVLLMMKPVPQQSLYRIAQRLFGTLLGVLLGEVWILIHPPLLFLIAGAALSAAAVPLVWNRNYWLVSFGATNLVIFLVSIAQFGHVDPAIPLVRTEATLYGCAISLIMILLFSRISLPPKNKML